MHRHPTSQTGHPGMPRCAHSGRIVALGLAVSQLQCRSPLRTPRLPRTPAALPAHACRAPCARLRSAAPRAPAHTRSFARACAQRPCTSTCSPSTLARSAYRAPSAVSWPPSRLYHRAQRRVAARPWPYRGRGRAPGLRPACPAPQYNIFVLQYDFQPTAPILFFSLFMINIFFFH